MQTSRPYQKRFLLLAALTAVIQQAYAFGPRPPAQKPWLMAVMGDSISAATLADVPIPYAPTPEESVKKWREQEQDSRLIYTNKKKLSWGSGIAITSHYVLLKKWFEEHHEARPLDILNVAHPGDETRDLPGQVDTLISEMRGGRYTGLKYLALTIGSNDACRHYSPATIPEARIRADLVSAFSRLAQFLTTELKQREPLRVLLVGAPRIPNLGAPNYLRAPTIFGLSCTTVRDRILRECNPLTLWSTQAEYLEKLSVVESINRILQSAALEIRAEFPAIEMVFSDRLYQLEIPLGALAADCFHPGRWAQEEISKQTWKDQEWFH